MSKQRGVIDAAILLCVAVGLGMWILYSWAYDRGYDAATMTAARNTQARVLADDNERARQKREADDAATRMRTESEALDTQLKESQSREKILQNERDRALRAGDKRVSIRAASCVPAAVPNDGATEPAAAGTQEARAELYGEDAARIYGITDDADDTARELNLCIDKYTSAADGLERYKRRLKGLQNVEAAKSAQPD